MNNLIKLSKVEDPLDYFQYLVLSKIVFHLDQVECEKKVSMIAGNKFRFFAGQQVFKASKHMINQKSLLFTT